MKKHEKILVWDLPVRIFHWLLVIGFIAAASIALIGGDDSSYFSYHAIIGLTLFFMVILRLIYGVIGSKYARFDSFAFSPKALGQYLKQTLTGESFKFIGHNPGSAYAIYTMLAILIGIGITGIMLGQGNESVEEIHETLVYVMIAAVAIHIFGVLFHTIRHRENIATSMIHGYKEGNISESINSSRPITAVVLVAIIALFSFGLTSNYDKANKTITIPLINNQIQVGEQEGDRDESENSYDYEEDED